LTKGLTSSKAPKLRILKEQKCLLPLFTQDLASDHQEVSSAVITCSQKFIIMTVGTCLHCVEIKIGKHLLTSSILKTEMSANLRIICCCEESEKVFLILSDGRLICFSDCSKEFGMKYECTEFETCIDQCSVCSIFVHREWLNICGSEGSQNVDFVRFKLEAGNVIENSGHVLPLRLTSSATTIQFHLFDPNVIYPFILCGLCNSDIEIWGKSADEDLHAIQILRNRTSGLGAINSICSMGRDTIAVGHDGGYVHIWSIDITANSVSNLDRQFGVSPKSEGLPRCFQTVSADKFSEDKHQINSQLFVINEQYGNSVIMHAETGVILHTFSFPSFPPHILHMFSGQSNNFVTVFELSVLCMEGSCLRHWEFQLQYVSDDRMPVSKKMAASAECQHRIPQNQVSMEYQESFLEANIVGDQNTLTDGPTSDNDRQFQIPEYLCDSSNNCHMKLPEFSAFQETASEVQQSSSMQSKSSGIMTKILARRSSPVFSHNETQKIHSQTGNVAAIGTQDDSAWKILRLQNRLHTNSNFDGAILEENFEEQ
jgi:hypothetical protein